MRLGANAQPHHHGQSSNALPVFFEGRIQAKHTHTQMEMHCVKAKPNTFKPNSGARRAAKAHRICADLANAKSEVGQSNACQRKSKPINCRQSAKKHARQRHNAQLAPSAGSNAAKIGASLCFTLPEPCSLCHAALALPPFWFLALLGKPFTAHLPIKTP